jgi:hypothetical protein
MQLIADNFLAKEQKQPVSPHAANPDPARPGSTRHLAIGALPVSLYDAKLPRVETTCSQQV